MKDFLSNKKQILSIAIWLGVIAFLLYFFRSAFDVVIEGNSFTLFFVLSAVLMLFVGFCNIAIKKMEISLEVMFVVIALCIGMIFAYVNPFGQEADGWIHFQRSVDVASGNWLLPFVDNNGNSALFRLPENIDEIDFRVVNPGGAEGYAMTEKVKAVYLSDKYIEVESMGGFASLFYAPQALGIVIANLLGLSVYGTMLCSRICNLMVYIALAAYGLKKMPIYRNIYLVIALLPMTLYQAASFSYDALLNGLSFLFIGLCFNYAYEKEQLKVRDALGLGIILSMLFYCKYVYVCLGLLVFIIPVKKFGDIKQYLKSFLIAICPLILCVVVMLSGLFMPPVDTTTAAAESISGVSQIDYVLENPLRIIKVLLNTFVLYTDLYIKDLNTFGWLNYSLAIAEYFVPIVMVFVALLYDKNAQEKVTTKDRVLYVVTFFVVVCAGMMGMFLCNTLVNPYAATSILGYQGRYMIPVLMLPMAALSSKRVKCEVEHFSLRLASVMAFTSLYAAIQLSYQCYQV